MLIPIPASAVSRHRPQAWLRRAVAPNARPKTAPEAQAVPTAEGRSVRERSGMSPDVRPPGRRYVGKLVADAYGDRAAVKLGSVLSVVAGVCGLLAPSPFRSA
jgi:hypothetical protein